MSASPPGPPLSRTSVSTYFGCNCVPSARSQAPCVIQTCLPGDGIVPLLHQRLSERLSRRGRAFLCQSAQHICSVPGLDSGWGCGWRNIQMLSWHLLRRSPDYRSALFAGLGAPPDIASLQAWLEWAWECGFDVVGAQQLGFLAQTPG